MLGNVNFVVERVAVDTACSLGPPGTSAVGVTEIMRRAAVVVDPLGFRHLQIDWHDHLLLMTIDTFKDKLGAKPNAREDLIRMVSAPQFDIDRMLVLVRRARLETLVAVVADWILTTGHCSPWADLRDRLDPTRVRGRYRRLFPWLVRLTSRSNRSIPLGLLARAASDSPPRRILALALGVVGTTRFFVRHGSFTIGGGRPQAGAVRTCGRS
jgi:hypothetical protein